MSSRRPEAARPRAFFPDYTAHAPKPARVPGWVYGLERRADDGRTLARGLAWFSMAVGLAEVIVPGRIAELLDLDEDHAELIRLYGFRELASGAGLFAQRHPTAGVWSRIAGDALDLASLGLAAGRSRRSTKRALGAMLLVAGVAALDVLAARQLHRSAAAADEQAAA